jgi:Fe-S cluster biogenesis protein NfuA
MSEVTPEYAAFGEAARVVADLAREFETLPYPRLREKATSLLQAVDTLHRQPLERLVSLLRSGGHETALEQLVADPLVRQLLQLYDLLPCDEVTQVEASLYSLWPYLQAHGGDLQVVSATEGVVRLRVSGTCQSCASSATSLRSGLEEALRLGYPAFKALVLEGGEASAPWRSDAESPGSTCPGCP